MEVRNRFKGLDLIDRVHEELWMDVCDIVQEVVSNNIPKKNKWKKVKLLWEETLQIAEKIKMKSKGERKSYILLNPSSREYEGDIRKPS